MMVQTQASRATARFITALAALMLLLALSATGAAAHVVPPEAANGSGPEHKDADAISLETQEQAIAMVRRQHAEERAVERERAGRGLPAVAPNLSDQEIRTRAFMGVIGLPVVSALSSAEREYQQLQGDTATTTPESRARALTRSGGPSIDEVPVNERHAKGYWSSVITPNYERGPGDPTDDNGIGDDAGTGHDYIQPRIVPVFEAIMPDGKVLYWDWLINGNVLDGGASTQSTRVLLWDPMNPNEPGVRVDYPNGNLFCTGFTHLPNGDLLLAGGNANDTNFNGLNETHIYHWRTKTWSQGPDLDRVRWYPSVAALANGESLILGGDQPDLNPAAQGYQPGDAFPEVFTASYASPATQAYSGGTLRPLSNLLFHTWADAYDNTAGQTNPGATPPSTRFYPFLVPSVDGRVLYAGPEPTVQLIDTYGNGASIHDTYSNFDREYGTYAYIGDGKTIVTGGGWHEQWTCDWILPPPAGCTAGAPNKHGATDSSTVIDVRSPGRSQFGIDDYPQGEPWVDDSDYGGGGSPARMHYPRRMNYNTVLPDGTVLATGGMSNTDPDNDGVMNPVDNDLNNQLVNVADATKMAELYDPQANTWTELSPASEARQYHSTAMLLPDGRVLTGGGGVCGACVKKPTEYYEPNFEIYSPPYLFNGDGSPAVQPQITGPLQSDGSAQVLPPVGYARNFSVGYTPGAAGRTITKAALVKLGAATHSTDQGQRYVPIDIVSDDDGSITLSSPPNSYEAPPGFYWLFLVNDAGVPSVAKVVQVGARLSLNNIRSVVSVYGGTSLSGRDQQLGIGEYKTPLGNFFDVKAEQISSLTVSSGYQARVCNEDDATDCMTFTQGTYNTLPANFDDSIRYIKVTPVDGTEPTVFITSPANGSTTQDSTATLNYTASDSSGEPPTCTPANGSTVHLAVGVNTVTVDCEDATGNTASATATITRTTPVTPPPDPPKPAPASAKLSNKIKRAASISFTATCPSGCTISPTIASGKKKLKLKAIKLKAAGGAQKVTIKLSKSQVKLLTKTYRKKKVTLTLVIVDAAGAKTGASGRFK